MNKFLIALFLSFLTICAFADTNPPCVRNDNGATVLQGTNGKFIPCAADSHGRSWQQPIVANIPLIDNQISGVTYVPITAEGPNVNGTFSILWAPGTASSYTVLTTPAAMEVVGFNANDSAAGTGARTVTISGLDASYNQFSEIVTMAGTTPVPLVHNSVIAINGAQITTTGSGDVNAASIDTRVIAGGAKQTRIDSGAGTFGYAHDGHFTIPAGYIGILEPISFSGTGVTGDLTLILVTTDNTGITRTRGFAKVSSDASGFNSGVGYMDLGRGLYLPEKTTFQIEGKVSAGTADVVASTNLILINTSLYP